MKYKIMRVQVKPECCGRIGISVDSHEEFPEPVENVDLIADVLSGDHKFYELGVNLVKKFEPYLHPMKLYDIREEANVHRLFGWEDESGSAVYLGAVEVGD
jgi:hypothetical protein